MEVYHISSDLISVKTISSIITENKQLALSEEAILNINKCRTYLDTKIDNNQKPIYGINTGFGSLCSIKISEEKLHELQENLVKSHACGTGEKVPIDVIRIMMILKIQSLSYGHSGVQLETVERLIYFYNHNIIPVIYTQGSLGASGDLAPLAHLSLPLIGEGEVYYKGTICSSTEVLKEHQLEPISLVSKEGLALLNGTQFMSAYGVYSIYLSQRLVALSDIIAALSIDAFDATLEPFDMLIHYVRPHKGQIKTAEVILDLLSESSIAKQTKNQVQDPYSFRCIPQVHGATKDTVDYVNKVFKTEINSVTDNPNIFWQDDKILSGGNFHGQPLAFALDFLSIAMCELGNISERRIYQLVSGKRELPEFLVDNIGLNSGLMIAQYTAASIVSLNKQLASPSSVDSIVSSNGQEDHVSMGANAAVKCLKIIENLETILAIELINASQAIEYRRPMQTSPFLESFLKLFRTEVPLIKEDRVLHYDIKNAVSFLKSFVVEID